MYLDWNYRQIMIFTATSSVVWWLLAVLMALRAFRLTRVVEQEAATLLSVKDQPRS